MSKSRWSSHVASVVIVAILVALAIGSTDTDKPRSGSSRKTSSRKASPSSEELAKQPSRKEFIQKLINRGIFQKVEVPGSLPHLWVKPAFYALDFDTKSQFVNIVYAYYITENPDYDIVVLYDSQTGKQIGKYAEVYGGLSLE